MIADNTPWRKNIIDCFQIISRGLLQRNALPIIHGDLCRRCHHFLKHAELNLSSYQGQVWAFQGTNFITCQLLAESHVFTLDLPC